MSALSGSKRGFGRDHARWGVVVGIGVLVALLLAPTPAADARPSPGRKVLFHLQDSRIDEASGLGVGVRSKGVDYVENDSGDVNRFFAVNAHTGATAAVVTVPHVTNVDWEDLQVAPDARGRSSVWLADTGDNAAQRREIDVYRVREPKVSPDGDDLALRSTRPAIWRLRYPGGPTDAESLAVTPQGRAYLVTKNILGASVVYALPSRPDAKRVQTLSQVGTIDFAAARGSSPVGSVGSVLATSAAVSRNGRVLAVRTYVYVYAYVWQLRPHAGNDGVAAVLRTTPTRVALPSQQQGEGLAVAGGRLLVDSEGVGTAVLSVPLPPVLRAAATGAALTPPAASTSTVSASAQSTPAVSTSPTRSRRPGKQSKFGGLSVLIVVVLLGGVVLLGRRARRFGGDGSR